MKSPHGCFVLSHDLFIVRVKLDPPCFRNEIFFKEEPCSVGHIVKFQVEKKCEIVHKFLWKNIFNA